MEWGFLNAVLRAFGFNEKFVKLIQQCISTVRYSLLLNGSIVSTFYPSRGLRQGDPLSPYLFIIGSEVLLRLINREQSLGNLSGVKVAGNAQPITKLYYADDVILFCKVKLQEVNSLVQCIDTYCEWSGQKVSIEKSGFFTSKGVHPQFKMQLKDSWGFQQLPQNTKYLGVPLFLSNNKSKDFRYVQERLESHLSGWKSKNLSWMERATLIKYVA